MLGRQAKTISQGDRSLEYWREAHKRYFTRLGRYAPDMVLWCERFEVVEQIQNAERET
jgi:uncharacterized protein YhfF